MIGELQYAGRPCEIIAWAKWDERLTMITPIKSNLHIKIENILRNYHRTAIFPESDDIETELAFKAIVQAFNEEGLTNFEDEG